MNDNSTHSPGVYFVRKEKIIRTKQTLQKMDQHEENNKQKNG